MGMNRGWTDSSDREVEELVREMKEFLRRMGEEGEGSSSIVFMSCSDWMLREGILD